MIKVRLFFLGFFLGNLSLAFLVGLHIYGMGFFQKVRLTWWAWTTHSSLFG